MSTEASGSDGEDRDSAELWVGIVELLSGDVALPEAADGAVSYVIARAKDGDEFVSRVHDYVAHEGWRVEGVNEVETLRSKRRRSGASDDLLEIADEVARDGHTRGAELYLYKDAEVDG